MPRLIEHIDAIARAKKRDVLFVVFHNNLRDEVNWEQLLVRKQVIEWLDANGIAWKPCGHIASTRIMAAYKGQIYIDLPIDEKDPTYQKVCNYLEKPDGTMAFDGMNFCYHTLLKAMENARHDEPDFWERWVENF